MRHGVRCEAPYEPAVGDTLVSVGVVPLTPRQPRAWLSTGILERHRQQNRHSKAGVPVEELARTLAASGAPVRAESLRDLVLRDALTHGAAYAVALGEEAPCLACPRGLPSGASVDGCCTLSRTEAPGAELAARIPGSRVVPAKVTACAISAFDEALKAPAPPTVSPTAAATLAAHGKGGGGAGVEVGAACSFAAARDAGPRVRGLATVLSMGLACRHLAMWWLVPVGTCERLVHQLLLLLLVGAAAARAGCAAVHSTHDTACMLLRYVAARARDDRGFLEPLAAALSGAGINCRVEWGDLRSPATVVLLFERAAAAAGALPPPQEWEALLRGASGDVRVSVGIDAPHAAGHMCSAHLGNIVVPGAGAPAAYIEMTWAAFAGPWATRLRGCGPGVWEAHMALRVLTYNRQRNAEIAGFLLTQLSRKIAVLTEKLAAARSAFAAVAATIAVDAIPPVAAANAVPALAGAAADAVAAPPLPAIPVAADDAAAPAVPRSLPWLEISGIQPCLDAAEWRLREIAISRASLGRRARTLASSGVDDWLRARTEVAALQALLTAGPATADAAPEAPATLHKEAFEALLLATYGNKAPTNIAGAVLRRHHALLKKGGGAVSPAFVKAVLDALEKRARPPPAAAAGSARSSATAVLQDLADGAAELRAARAELAGARGGDGLLATAVAVKVGRLRDECSALVVMLGRLWGPAGLGGAPPLLPSALEEGGLDGALFTAGLSSISPAIMAGVRARHEARRAVEALADAVHDVKVLQEGTAQRVTMLEVRT